MEFPLTANKANWFPVYERVDVSEKPEPAGPYRCIVTGALCGLKPLMFTFSHQSVPIMLSWMALPTDGIDQQFIK